MRRPPGLRTLTHSSSALPTRTTPPRWCKLCIEMTASKGSSHASASMVSAQEADLRASLTVMSAPLRCVNPSSCKIRSASPVPHATSRIRALRGRARAPSRRSLRLCEDFLRPRSCSASYASCQRFDSTRMGADRSCMTDDSHGSRLVCKGHYAHCLPAGGLSRSGPLVFHVNSHARALPPKYRHRFNPMVEPNERRQKRLRHLERKQDRKDLERLDSVSRMPVKEAPPSARNVRCFPCRLVRRRQLFDLPKDAQPVRFHQHEPPPRDPHHLRGHVARLRHVVHDVPRDHDVER